MDEFLLQSETLTVLCASWICGLFCVVQINTKHKRADILKRIAWSIVVFAPVAGPLLYGALFFGSPGDTCTKGSAQEISNLDLWIS